MGEPALQLAPEIQKRHLQLAKLTEPVLPARYVPHKPTPRQAAALLLDAPEVLYGGAAGGGKSDCLLMGALQYVDVPGYNALLLRRTFSQASKAEALIPRSHEWLSRTDAHWNGEKSTWSFPSGATLEIGHCQHDNDRYNYQGGAYQFIGLDELTQFTLTIYRYLFSRRRRLRTARIPVRTFCGSNPGGVGHEWVRSRFLIEKKPTRRFVPAKLQDNPYLDADDYIKSLMELDPKTRQQLLDGDWEVSDKGKYFEGEWFEIVKAAPAGAKSVRAWDLAALNPKKVKEAKKKSADSDYVSGCRMSVADGVYYIEDMRRKRLTPSGIMSLLKQTAAVDSRKCRIWIEQEPGSSGVIVIDLYVKALAGYVVRGQPSSSDKLVRAAPMASQAEAGNVKLVEGPWNRDFIDEMEKIGTDSSAHDDQCDSASLAFAKLAKGRLQIRGAAA